MDHPYHLACGLRSGSSTSLVSLNFSSFPPSHPHPAVPAGLQYYTLQAQLSGAAPGVASAADMLDERVCCTGFAGAALGGLLRWQGGLRWLPALRAMPSPSFHPPTVLSWMPFLCAELQLVFLYRFLQENLTYISTMLAMRPPPLESEASPAPNQSAQLQSAVSGQSGLGAAAGDAGAPSEGVAGQVQVPLQPTVLLLDVKASAPIICLPRHSGEKCRLLGACFTRSCCITAACFVFVVTLPGLLETRN